MDKFHLYLYSILLVKILFIFFIVRYFYFTFLVRKNPKNIEYQKKKDSASLYKKQTEFVFTIMMALLLIYLFHPLKNNDVRLDKHTKMLIYLFGFIVILTSDWREFLENAKIL
jgi:Na+/H+ antiporter NhaD/arsenite permease-like protein